RALPDSFGAKCRGVRRESLGERGLDDPAHGQIMERGLGVLDGRVLARQITRELRRTAERGHGRRGGRTDDVPELAELATELSQTSRHPTDLAQEPANRNG